MKRCFKCLEYKPPSEFYAHKGMADGYLGKCKDCTKSYEKDRRSLNVEKIREYDRSRSMLPHRVEAREEYQKTDNGKQKIKGARIRYYERNPSKRAAHILVGNAIRDGRLTKMPCEICGNIKSQAHHDDYGKPLDVRWLCTTHHREWHKCNNPVVPEV